MGMHMGMHTDTGTDMHMGMPTFERGADAPSEYARFSSQTIVPSASSRS